MPEEVCYSLMQSLYSIPLNPTHVGTLNFTIALGVLFEYYVLDLVHVAAI